MTKHEFIAEVTAVMKSCGFSKQGNHFYLDCGNSWLCVLGMQKSCYGEYYYLEYGFAITSANPKMPYPKFSELNINCGRMFVNGSKAFSYNDLQSAQVAAALTAVIPGFAAAGKAGTSEILAQYVPNCHYLIGQVTLQHLGITECRPPVYPEKLWE